MHRFVPYCRDNSLPPKYFFSLQDIDYFYRVLYMEGLEKPGYVVWGEKLLEWYRTNQRDLLWRERKDPYRVWISEVILQQTQVRQGAPYFERFVQRFPTVESLATASAEEVLLYWKGLGYYSRALNLHRAAQKILHEFGGNFPTEYQQILSLPGVGPYTASAISSIAFSQPVAAVDTNLYRVLARFFLCSVDIATSGAYRIFSELALKLMPRDRPGEFNQAMMDLGASVCKPLAPLCHECPLREGCLAFSRGTMEEYPVKQRKTKVSTLSMQYYFVNDGLSYLIQQRSEKSIWKRLYEFPTEIEQKYQDRLLAPEILQHRLSHRALTIRIDALVLSTWELEQWSKKEESIVVPYTESAGYSYPRPLERYLEKWLGSRS